MRNVSYFRVYRGNCFGYSSTRNIWFAGPCHSDLKRARVRKVQREFPAIPLLGTSLHLIRKLSVFIKTSQRIATVPRFLSYSPRSPKCSFNLLFRQDYNVVGSDVIHRLYQGISYFQNFIWFQVSLITPVREVLPSLNFNRNVSRSLKLIFAHIGQ